MISKRQIFYFGEQFLTTMTCPLFNLQIQSIVTRVLTVNCSLPVYFFRTSDDMLSRYYMHNNVARFQGSTCCNDNK